MMKGLLGFVAGAAIGLSAATVAICVSPELPREAQKAWRKSGRMIKRRMARFMP